MSSSPPPPKKPKMSSSDDPPSPTAPVASSEPRRRYKRRKVAIFLAYCGSGYQGMQKNPGARTIEGDLEDALFLAGGVPDHDRALPRRYDWARAARTDKGVSAAGQVVSGRFYVDPPGFVERLNSHLSPQIRIFGFKRVTASFNAKKFCDRRRYVYLLPVFALNPNAHPDRESVIASLGTGNELAKCLECSERGRKVAGLMGKQSKISSEGESSDFGNGGSAYDAGEYQTQGKLIEENEGKKGEALASENVNHYDMAKATKNGLFLVEEQSKLANEGESTVFETVGCSDIVHESLAQVKPIVENKENKVEALVAESVSHEEMANASKSEFFYGDKEKERFSSILKRYVGTHNFHNFTTRTKAEDPSARRYIISFEADRVVSIEGVDFVRCEVVGQSFMLHQIRKMIGLAVAIMRNCAPESIMDIALKQDVNINVPTAPEVGLYLDECLFTSYNQKWKDSHEELSIEAYAEQVEEFRMKYIFSHIASMELKEGAVALWLHSLNHRNYPDFCYMENNGNCGTQEHRKMDNEADSLL